jgi:hypothetical protein
MIAAAAKKHWMSPINNMLDKILLTEIVTWITIHVDISCSITIPFLFTNYQTRDEPFHTKVSILVPPIYYYSSKLGSIILI